MASKTPRTMVGEYMDASYTQTSKKSRTQSMVDPATPRSPSWFSASKGNARTQRTPARTPQRTPIFKSADRSINSPGRVLKSPGRPLDSPGRTLKPTDRAIHSPGRLIKPQDRPLISPGRIVKPADRVINSPGRVLKSPGRSIQHDRVSSLMTKRRSFLSVTAEEITPRSMVAAFLEGSDSTVPIVRPRARTSQTGVLSVPAELIGDRPSGSQQGQTMSRDRRRSVPRSSQRQSCDADFETPRTLIENFLQNATNSIETPLVNIHRIRKQDFLSPEVSIPSSMSYHTPSPFKPTSSDKSSADSEVTRSLRRKTTRKFTKPSAPKPIEHGSPYLSSDVPDTKNMSYHTPSPFKSPTTPKTIEMRSMMHRKTPKGHSKIRGKFLLDIPEHMLRTEKSPGNVADVEVSSEHIFVDSDEESENMDNPTVRNDYGNTGNTGSRGEHGNTGNHGDEIEYGNTENQSEEGKYVNFENQNDENDQEYEQAENENEYEKSGNQYVESDHEYENGENQDEYENGENQDDESDRENENAENQIGEIDHKYENSENQNDYVDTGNQDDENDHEYENTGNQNDYVDTGNQYDESDQEYENAENRNEHRDTENQHEEYRINGNRNQYGIIENIVEDSMDSTKAQASFSEDDEGDDDDVDDMVNDQDSVDGDHEQLHRSKGKASPRDMEADYDNAGEQNRIESSPEPDDVQNENIDAKSSPQLSNRSFKTGFNQSTAVPDNFVPVFTSTQQPSQERNEPEQDVEDGEYEDVPDQEPVVQVKKKQVRKPRQKSPYSLPVSVVKKQFTHFSKMRVSKDAIEETMKVSEIYWDNLASDLQAYALHAGRKTITMADFHLLFKRQGLVNDKVSLYSLIEKYLPMEERRKLIPVARAGNRIELLK